ncbi:hypothetical protein POJ06DRAFT_271980 [Lipomyces tetrasporus]|uniref:Uncharacterized protein n=1 Tax=Lipomyces tetrasporus TaxID=54092 RepID=A0AAD7QKK5_9ASCO|nr:uncharacterized protein POJ06DRAFT_271980 [Lipomyces tetrasporus]KAJ8096561.1 hypothetical protein POJ06DRAFT_271980 [Lipomyces tetrasporus]
MSPKVVVITGSNRGIGFELATQFSESRALAPPCIASKCDLMLMISGQLIMLSRTLRRSPVKALMSIGIILECTMWVKIWPQSAKSSRLTCKKSSTST